MATSSSATNRHNDAPDGRMNDREGDARSTAEAVARRSYGKLVAFLAARTRDVAQAEDALAEAFASALADWPLNGCPSNPEAWLITAARRKIIDAARKRSRGEFAACTAADPRRWAGRRGSGRGNSRPAACADVCLRASGDRDRHSRAVDPAGGAGAQRRDHRVGLPHLARGHVQAAGPRQGQDPAGRHRLRDSRAREHCRAARCRARRHLCRLRRRLDRPLGN